MNVDSCTPPRKPHARQATTGVTGRWPDRLIADATAELRQPLEMVAESIARVMAVDAGQLTTHQWDSLRDALAACQQTEAIATGLRRLNRRREHGQVHRRWFDLTALRTETDRLLAARMPHRRDAIRWHGFDGNRRVYGDSAIASRLLAGWITSAMRHTGSTLAGGKAILVRAHTGGNRAAVKLVVSVEDGCFFGGETSGLPGQIVHETNDWVELAVWRSLAAALLAHPELTLRPNGGWEIAVELPNDSATHVAIQWAKWRLAQRCHRDGAITEDTPSTIPQTFVTPGVENRVNRLLCAMMSTEVGPGPLHADQATILTIVAGATVASEAIEAFHRKLEDDLGMYELAYRVAPRRWTLVWDVEPAQARTRIETLAAENYQPLSPIRLQWSSIGTLPIRDHHAARILADRIAREMLTDPDSSTVAIGPATDTPRLRPSTVPSDRLVAEMRHLAARVRAQNDHLLDQARQLRPQPGAVR